MKHCIDDINFKVSILIREVDLLMRTVYHNSEKKNLEDMKKTFCPPKPL